MDTRVSQKNVGPIFRVDGSAILHDLTFRKTLIHDTPPRDKQAHTKLYIQYMGEMQNWGCLRKWFSFTLLKSLFLLQLNIPLTEKLFISFTI